LTLVPVRNRLFGNRVGVTGLLSGADLWQALQSRKRGGERLLIAADMLRAGHGAFLDDWTVRSLARKLNVKARIIRDPKQLVRAILD
jgi:NifB/MoaA-like Fe-S oxidoreductase